MVPQLFDMTGHESLRGEDEATALRQVQCLAAFRFMAALIKLGPSTCAVIWQAQDNHCMPVHTASSSMCWQYSCLRRQLSACKRVNVRPQGSR